METGTFSVSLTVKNIQKSFDFYRKLGFTQFGGNLVENWIMLKNGDCVIGLFQDMFEKNMLTFNPGWDNDAKNIDKFTDIRVIQKDLSDNGIKIINEVNDIGNGPGSFVIEDPDGNPILFDQHR